MDVNLLRNGYSLERRKMYIQNPRHNLRSSLDFGWEKSLMEKKSNIVERRKEKSSEQVRDNYQKAIEKIIEEDAKLNKSSFRVMPPQKYPFESKKGSSLYRQTLHNEIDHYENSKRSLHEAPPTRRSGEKQMKKKQAFSKSVFGYHLHPESFKKESYLSMVLGDRLSPYLPSSTSQHRSLAINHPVTLNY